nr:MAG TPA: hypothetical protein [Caudoviricetes sp.]
MIIKINLVAFRSPMKMSLTIWKRLLRLYSMH